MNSMKVQVENSRWTKWSTDCQHEGLNFLLMIDVDDCEDCV